MVWTLTTLSTGLCLSAMSTSSSWTQDVGRPVTPSSSLPDEAPRGLGRRFHSHLDSNRTALARDAQQQKDANEAGDGPARAPAQSGVEGSHHGRAGKRPAPVGPRYLAGRDRVSVGQVLWGQKGKAGWVGETEEPQGRESEDSEEGQIFMKNAGSSMDVEADVPTTQRGRQAKAAQRQKRETHADQYTTSEPGHQNPPTSPDDVQQTTGSSRTEESRQCYARLLPAVIHNHLCDMPLWSCANRCGQFHQTPCSCHTNCLIYKTCCLDFADTCFPDGSQGSALPLSTPPGDFDGLGLAFLTPFPSPLTNDYTTPASHVHHHGSHGLLIPEHLLNPTVSESVVTTTASHVHHHGSHGLLIPEHLLNPTVSESVVTTTASHVHHHGSHGLLIPEHLLNPTVSESVVTTTASHVHHHGSHGLLIPEHLLNPTVSESVVTTTASHVHHHGSHGLLIPEHLLNPTVSENVVTTAVSPVNHRDSLDLLIPDPPVSETIPPFIPDFIFPPPTGSIDSVSTTDGPVLGEPFPVPTDAAVGPKTSRVQEKELMLRSLPGSEPIFPILNKSVALPESEKELTPTNKPGDEPSLSRLVQPSPLPENARENSSTSTPGLEQVFPALGQPVPFPDLEKEHTSTNAPALEPPVSTSGQAAPFPNSLYGTGTSTPLAVKDNAASRATRNADVMSGPQEAQSLKATYVTTSPSSQSHKTSLVGRVVGGAEEDSGGAHLNRKKRLAIQSHGPQVACIPHINARLIASCPEDTLAIASEVAACLAAASPSSLTQLMPATDPITGLHYGNIYCYRCWKLRGHPSAGTRDLQPPLSWRADLILNAEHRPEIDTSMSDIIDYITTHTPNVDMKSPEGHPYHFCGTQGDDFFLTRDSCPACDDGSEPDFSRLCQGHSSYVTTSIGLPYLFNNKYCYFCHVAYHAYYRHADGDSLYDNVTEAMVESVHSAQCMLPEEAAVRLQPPADSGYIVNVQWDITTSTWILDNMASRTDQVMGSPSPRQVRWKHLQCTETGCSALSCAYHSVMRDGTCIQDFVPFITVVFLCLATSPDLTECSTNISDFATTQNEAVELLARIEDAVVDTLIKQSLWKFNAGISHVQVSRAASTQSGFMFTVRSETANQPSDISIDNGQVEKYLQKELLNLGLRGWCSICLMQEFYRIDESVFANSSCMLHGESRLSQFTLSSSARGGRFTVFVNVVSLVALTLITSSM